MSAHWIVLAAAAVFIPALAGIRSGHRIQASTVSPVQASSTAAAPTHPSLWAQVSEALESWEDSSPAGGSMVSLNSDGAESVTVEIRGELLVCPKDDDHGPLVRVWIDWRRQALDALPESLRNDSDHQRAIDETYRQAIRGFLIEEVAVRYELEELQLQVDISSRMPPPGGWEIGGVGFTDIDERGDTAPAESITVRSLTIEMLNRVKADFLSDRQVLVETFAEPPSSQQAALDFWIAWKHQAIAALPESLRLNSEYQAAIEAQYQAAIAQLGLPMAVGKSTLD